MEDISVDGRITFELISKKSVGTAWTGSGTGKGHVAGTFEHGNKPSDFIKCGKFLDKPTYYEIPKRDSAHVEC